MNNFEGSDGGPLPPKSPQQHLEEIEARVRRTIGPTFTAANAWTVPTMLGSISEADFNTLIGIAREAFGAIGECAKERLALDRMAKLAAMPTESTAFH